MEGGAVCRLCGFAGVDVRLLHSSSGGGNNASSVSSSSCCLHAVRLRPLVFGCDVVVGMHANYCGGNGMRNFRSDFGILGLAAMTFAKVPIDESRLL